MFSALDDPVTLTFDLMTSNEMHVYDSSWTIPTPSLVMISHAVFVLECGQTNKQTNRQTNRQTDAAKSPTHAPTIVGVSNNDLVTMAPKLFI